MTDGIIPTTPDASTPSPLNPTPPDFNPFADDKGVIEGPVASQGNVPLLERMRLHFKQGQVKETPFGALSHFGDTAVEQGAEARGNPSDLENEAIDRAVKNRDDLASYDRMPGAEGFLEYGAAIAGRMVGNVADPTSLIGNVVKIPYLAARGVMGRMAEFGVNQAIVNTATDPVVQGLNIASKDGTRDDYSLFQTLVESPIGGFVGGATLKGAHEAGVALFVKPQAEKDALTFFKMIRDHGGADEQKRWPEIYDAVQGKSDAELNGMAREVAADDKVAAGKPKSEATPQSEANKIAAEAPKGSQTTVEINGEKAVGEKIAAAKVDDATAIGDVLAARHDATQGPEGALQVAVRPMEASLSRAPEAAQARSTVTTNMVEAPNLRQMWTDLADSLEATVRQGRLVSKGAAGEYGTQSGVIRMKNLDDLTVLAHELGHHVEVKYGLSLNNFGHELDAMTAYAASHVDPVVRRKEGFAEFFRLFVENPREAENRAPNFYNEFSNLLQSQPELKAALTKTQGQFDAYRHAFAEDIIDANIATSVEPRGWAKLRSDVRNNGFWNTITERGSMVYTGLLDEKNSLAVAVQALLKTQKGNTGNIISLIAADDPYKLIRLATNAHQAGMIDMMHGVVPWRSNTPEGPSLYDAIALATGKPNILSGWDEEAVSKFSGYLIARRAVFEWERYAARVAAGEKPKEPLPFARDMYETKIREYEAANPNANSAATMVHDWTKNLLKKEFESGLITRESYDGALQIRDYVPLMRDMSDKSNTGGGSGFDAGQVGLKQFKGSTRPVVDPLESLMQRSFQTAELIAHNDAIKALGALADKAGVGAGQIVERVPANEIKAKYVDPLEALRKGLEDAGASKVDADLAISHMLNSLNINGQDIGPAAIFRSQQAAERGENIVFYLSGGEMKALRLKEGDFGKELVNTLTGGLSSPLRDWNLQGLQKVSQVLRAGVTTSPDFFITNLLRDQMATWILNRGTLPFVDSIRGIFRELTNSELSRSYAQMGGIAGGANLNAIDHARIDKDIQALASKGFTVARLASWEGYFKAIELSETGTRQGLFGVSYKRALKQGLSPYEASVEAAFAANDNLDFGRHGSRIGDTIKIIPFLNAQMQGLDKAWRTLVTPAFKEALTKQDVEAQKTMLSAYAKIAGVTGLSMALRSAYIDDPEYGELSPYLRNTHWVVRVPGLKGNSVVDAFGRTVEVPPGLQNLWAAIPKPFELAILPNLGERAVEMLANKDQKALARWAWGAKDLVVAKWMMDSVGVKLYAEALTGKDTFAGRDIVPERVAGNEPWMQATAGTSEIAKVIGQSADKAERAVGMDGGGLSPMYIDHIIKGVGGSWGRTFLSLSDAAIGTKGDRSLADTAITQRVFKEAYRGSTSLQEFWGQVAKTNGALSQAANTYDAMASNPAEQASYVARLPEDKRVFVIMNKSDFPADEKRLHPLYRAHEAINAISGMTREIADQNLTASSNLEPIKLSSSEQRVALDALGRIRMWEARNSMIVSGNSALKGQKPGPIEADMEMLEKTVPAVYDELAQRYANAKVYKASAIADHWDEVRQSVIDDGSSAKLSGIARDVERDGYELEARRSKAKKVRPQIPGVSVSQ